MNINPLTAAQFYTAAKPATSPEPDGGHGAVAFTQVAQDFVQTMQDGEATAQAAMKGEADMPTLVEALAKSELAIETAVTIRDRVVEAYQEILRMPV